MADTQMADAQMADAQLADIIKTILSVSLLVFLGFSIFDEPGGKLIITLFGIYGIVLIIIQGILVEVLMCTLISFTLGTAISFIPIAIMKAIQKNAERKNTQRVEEE